MPPLNLEQLFNMPHWFDPNPGPPGPYDIALVVFFLLGLAISLYYYFFRERLFEPSSYKGQLARRFATIGMGLAGSGLLFLLFRYLTIPILSARAWLYIILLAALGFSAYLTYFFLRLYPSRQAAYQAERLRKKYLPKPKPRPAGTPNSKSKRRKGKRR
ncbi:MAG: hypothetical protein M1136_04555 [Chloroflexi bacterium]|nr:hypothetical protein [Chloroflexota bacterium]